MEPLISIIIPVYNAEKTIIRCINSIVDQSFTNWELILIDDGSIDKSLTICREYASKDNRIKVFNKENGCVSSARNLGLDNVAGKWITFVDSDDWIKKDYLKNLLNHAEKEYSIDLVISYAEVFSDIGSHKEHYNSNLITKETFEIMFMENDMHWHTSPWSKLYKRSVIENIKLRFCDGMHIGEDAVFLYSYMLQSKKIYISSDTDYCYYACMEGSLTKKINDLNSELLSYNKINSLVRYIIKTFNVNNRKALDNLYWLIATYQRRVLNAIYHNNVTKKHRMKILKDTDWYMYIYYSQMYSYTFKESLLIFLLKRKFYHIYDFVRFFNLKLKFVSKVSNNFKF